MSIKRWDNFSSLNEESGDYTKPDKKKYDINVKVDDTLELIDGIVDVLLGNPKEGYSKIGELLDKNDKLIEGFPKKGTEDFDKFHDDLFERLRRAIRIAIKHVNVDKDEDEPIKSEKQTLLKESKIYQSRPPQHFSTLSKAIEEAGFKNSYNESEIEVDGRIEDGNIFIDDEPLNFTVFENGEIYWNDFSGSKKVGQLDKYEKLVLSLKKFLTK